MTKAASPKSSASNSPTEATARPDAVVAPAAAFLRSARGRLTLVGAFTALLAVTQTYGWPGTGVVLTLTSLLPQYRRPILALAALGVVYLVPPVAIDRLQEWSVLHGAERWVPAWPLVVAAVLSFGCAYAGLVRRFPKSLPGRRPVIVLVALLTLLLITAAHAPLGGLSWFVVTTSAMALSSYLWFFAYAASDSKLRGVPPPVRQIGYWRPFWGFSNVPLGKGAAYLERVEARDPDQLAFAQLNGLRLMVWAAVLSFGLHLFRQALYMPHGEFSGITGQLLYWLPPDGLPAITALVERHQQGNPYPLATRWAAVIAAFISSVLYMAAWGHTIIATCRMAGFNAAPNTDQPLLATSVSDFFNRYYYYFKELLAAFFFFPTYLRFFKSRPKVRLFVATVMAAGVGNFLFHFLRDSHEIHRLGFWNALVAYHVYAAYALILGVAIAISQLRLLARHRRERTGVRRVLATAGVITFYCLLNVLDVETAPSCTIVDYASFYLSLMRP